MIFFIAISIGFQLEEYTFFEPQFDTPITNVTLVKEGGRITEQVLGLLITYTANTAGLEVDYTLGGINGTNSQARIIQPNVQNITISFLLLTDEIPEGTETFRISSSAQENFPTFEAPTTIFTSAVISILDNDCEYCYLVTLLIKLRNQYKPLLSP